VQTILEGNGMGFMATIPVRLAGRLSVRARAGAYGRVRARAGACWRAHAWPYAAGRPGLCGRATVRMHAVGVRAHSRVPARRRQAWTSRAACDRAHARDRRAGARARGRGLERAGV
jgi:hypothetical protein